MSGKIKVSVVKKVIPPINHKGANIIQGTMNDINLQSYIGKVDLLAGGVPCQSFSLAGKKQGLLDPRGDLMLQFIKMIAVLQPKVFLIENVKGLLLHEKGSTLQKIISLINDINLYNISYKVLNAVNFSVP